MVAGKIPRLVYIEKSVQQFLRSTYPALFDEEMSAETTHLYCGPSHKHEHSAASYRLDAASSTAVVALHAKRRKQPRTFAATVARIVIGPSTAAGRPLGAFHGEENRTITSKRRLRARHDFLSEECRHAGSATRVNCRSASKFASEVGTDVGHLNIPSEKACAACRLASSARDVIDVGMRDTAHPLVHCRRPRPSTFSLPAPRAFHSPRSSRPTSHAHPMPPQRSDPRIPGSSSRSFKETMVTSLWCSPDRKPWSVFFGGRVRRLSRAASSCGEVGRRSPEILVAGMFWVLAKNGDMPMSALLSAEIVRRL